MLIPQDIGSIPETEVNVLNMKLSRKILTDLLLNGETVPEVYLLACAAGTAFIEGKISLQEYIPYVDSMVDSDPFQDYLPHREKRKLMWGLRITQLAVCGHTYALEHAVECYKY